jgi:DNA-binding transcriptional ArsR family regulator
MKKLDDRAMQHVADYFRALSEPLRLKILNALREREHNVGELTELCECSQANVSKHLALLAQSGIVERENRGTSVYYHIADRKIYGICDLVCGQLAEHFADRAALHASVSGKPIRKTGAGKIDGVNAINIKASGKD